MSDKKENPVLYVVLNGELNMSAGKAAAQAVHAAMLLEGNYPGLFVAGYKRTVVVLEAENGETIKNLLEYLQGAGIFAAYYIDEMSENGEPYQVTALAVEPIEHDDEEKRSILQGFNLFRDSLDSRNAYKSLARYTNAEGYASVPWYVRKTVKWLGKRA